MIPDSRISDALARLTLFAILIGALVMPLARPARAQPDPFPRTVFDDTGAPVTLPRRPQVVLLIGHGNL